MSILFKGMEMPKSCGECRFAGVCGVHSVDEWPDLESIVLNDVIGVGGERDQNCPLFPVPSHGDLIDRDAYQYSGDLMDEPVIIPAEEKGENYCANCHWYESEQQYCFRNGCHAYNESTCEHWEPMPADEPIPAPGGKTVPTTYDLLYEEGGPDA